jgi:dTDP-4-dehydrorhamnose 3,5-epimerase
MIKSKRIFKDCFLFQSKSHTDHRGYLFERFKKDVIEEETGVDIHIAQENVSHSVQNVIRGIHYQFGPPQHKLVSVDEGIIFDVVVDLRVGSSTFGKWAGVYLGGEDEMQLWVPSGFGHGFQVVSESARVNYKMTEPWNPELESGINPLDKTLNIHWPMIDNAIMSEKDQNLLGYNEAKYFNE